MLTQKTNTHVETVVGNGITIYRPKSYEADPGAFAVGGTNGNYEVVDKTLVSSKVDDIQSYVDLEPATGLGVRSKRRFGVSHSIWECDPSTNTKCKLSRKSDGSDKCYGTVGDEIYNNLTASVKTVLDSSSKNDFTYPCSAANLMTPQVVGGKLIPMYWYEDSRQEVGINEVNKISDLANEHYAMFESFLWTWSLGWIIWITLGLSMLLRCFCFAPEREYLRSGAVDGKGKNATASSIAGSTATSSIAAASTVEK